MRVIFLTITFHPEPNAIHGLPLARELARNGYEVKVLTAFPQWPIGKIYPGYRMKLWQWETIEGIKVLRVPIYPSHDNSAVRRVMTYLSFAITSSIIGTALIGPADVVYLYEPPPTNGLASMVLKLFRGTPIVHGIADMWPETVVESGMVRSDVAQRALTIILGAWCRFLYRQASTMTVLSRGFKRLLIQRGVPAEKIRVVFNWTDEEMFQADPADERLRRQLGFEGKFNVVYAGNLGVYQGIDTVIRAAALIKHHPNIQVVLVGVGPTERQLRKLAAELGTGNVLFLGRRPYEEMPKINALADVLLIHLRDRPFLRSTIPGKTQVSLASGRPILMAVRGDAMEIVQEAGAGVACDPENPEAMAAAMVEMATMTPSELADMGAKGRKYYLENLSMDTAFAAFDAIFKDAAAEHGGARRPIPVKR